jgi:hypothetical protein
MSSFETSRPTDYFDKALSKVFLKGVSGRRRVRHSDFAEDHFSLVTPLVHPTK